MSNQEICHTERLALLIEGAATAGRPADVIEFTHRLRFMCEDARFANRVAREEGRKPLGERVIEGMVALCAILIIVGTWL